MLQNQVNLFIISGGAELIVSCSVLLHGLKKFAIINNIIYLWKKAELHPQHPDTDFLSNVLSIIHYCLIDWFIVRLLTHWLIDRWSNIFIWLTNAMLIWLMHWYIDYPCDWLIYWSFCLIDYWDLKWLFDWLSDLFVLIKAFL